MTFPLATILDANNAVLRPPAGGKYYVHMIAPNADNLVIREGTSTHTLNGGVNENGYLCLTRNVYLQRTSGVAVVSYADATEDEVDLKVLKPSDNTLRAPDAATRYLVKGVWEAGASSPGDFNQDIFVVTDTVAYTKTSGVWFVTYTVIT